MLLPLLLNNLFDDAVAGFLTFPDFGTGNEVDFGCEPLPQSTVSIRRSHATGRSQGFVSSRQVYVHPLRRVSFNWPFANEGTRQMILDTYDATLGGTLAFEYVPKNGEDGYDVQFAMAPLVEVARSAAAWRIRIVLEEKL